MERTEASFGGMKIGLIGGLSLRAGIFYYEQIARRCTFEARRLDLVLGHADLGTVLACVASGDRAELGRYLGSLAASLFDAGADVVAISAVAPHIAIEEISKAARGPIASVLPLIPAALRAAGIDRVAVFGNRAVMETGVFGAVPESMLVDMEPSILDEVHGMYSDIALAGKRGSQPEMTILDDMAQNLILQGGAQAILLAGTDLSSFYAERRPGYPSIDVAQLHITEILRLATGDDRRSA